MRVGSAVVVVVLLALLSACGGGSSSSDRMAACRLRYRAGLTDTAAARRSVSELCAQLERAGVLDDQGATTADQLRTLLETHPDALSPLCQLSLQASLGTGTAAAARYLPLGEREPLHQPTSQCKGQNSLCSGRSKSQCPIFIRCAR